MVGLWGKVASGSYHHFRDWVLGRPVYYKTEDHNFTLSVLPNHKAWGSVTKQMPSMHTLLPATKMGIRALIRLGTWSDGGKHDCWMHSTGYFLGRIKIVCWENLIYIFRVEMTIYSATSDQAKQRGAFFSEVNRFWAKKGNWG